MDPDMSGDSLFPAGFSMGPFQKHVPLVKISKSARDLAKELAKPPDSFTLSMSLKQPGPRHSMVQCFLKRDKTTSTYELYLELPTGTQVNGNVEHGKFLLAAQKLKSMASTEYIISSNADHISRGSSSYVGELRSNFVGSKFTIYDCESRSSSLFTSVNHSGRKTISKKNSPRPPPVGICSVAHIYYSVNILGLGGPRRFHCALPSAGFAPISTYFMNASDPILYPGTSYPELRLEDDISEFESMSNSLLCRDEPLVLMNKPPSRENMFQYWCLNFGPRVTVKSVRNFQVIYAEHSLSPTQNRDHQKVLLQFGKIGKDLFTMDYCYPLSTFQAFAICLSSFTKRIGMI